MSTALAKYRQIYEILRKDIESGKYAQGQRLPSEHVLARTSGSSRITVNRALRELQNDGYITRRPGSGSYVSEKRTQPLTFGLLIPDLGTTEIFEPICQGMVDAQRSHQYALVWGRSVAGPEATEAQARDAVNGLISRKVSGVFFAPLESNPRGDLINLAVAEMIDQARMVMVLLDRDIVAYPGRSKYDLVAIDNRRAGYTMTQHLIRAGCRRVGFVGRPHMAPSCVARAAGYRDAVLDAENQDAPFIERFDPNDSDRVLKLMERFQPDGLVCSNDRTAAELIGTLTGLKIEVPGQVRIGAFDDVRYAHLLSVPLTTIRQPCDRLGAAAIRAMMERLGDPGMPARDILVDFHLVVRKSCGTIQQPERQVSANLLHENQASSSTESMGTMQLESAGVE